MKNLIQPDFSPSPLWRSAAATLLSLCLPLPWPIINKEYSSNNHVGRFLKKTTKTTVQPTSFLHPIFTIILVFIWLPSTSGSIPPQLSGRGLCVWGTYPNSSATLKYHHSLCFFHWGICCVSCFSELLFCWLFYVWVFPGLITISYLIDTHKSWN